MITTIKQETGVLKLVTLTEVGNTFVDPLAPNLVLDNELLERLRFDRSKQKGNAITLAFSESDPGEEFQPIFVDYDAATDNFVLDGVPLHVVNKENHFMVAHRFYALLIPATPQWIFIGK